jgi:hypothetical protein
MVGLLGEIKSGEALLRRTVTDELQLKGPFYTHILLLLERTESTIQKIHTFTALHYMNVKKIGGIESDHRVPSFDTRTFKRSGRSITRINQHNDVPAPCLAGQLV